MAKRKACWCRVGLGLGLTLTLTLALTLALTLTQAHAEVGAGGSERLAHNVPGFDDAAELVGDHKVRVRVRLG